MFMHWSTKSEIRVGKARFKDINVIMFENMIYMKVRCIKVDFIQGNRFLFLKFICLLLKDNCFTEFCCFLSNFNMNLLYGSGNSNTLYFYCILLLLFYKDEWNLKKNANNTNDKKCRGHKFKSIETKVELISQSKSCKLLASSWQVLAKTGKSKEHI